MRHEAAVPVLSAVTATSSVFLKQRSEKSLTMAYVLWLIGGWFGWHLIYLQQDEQAALCQYHSQQLSFCASGFTHCTFVFFLVLVPDAGSLGGFLLGWLRDLWRLPSYVAYANATVECVETLRLHYRLSPSRPPWSMTTLIAQLLFAFWFGELASTTFELFQVSPHPRFPSLGSAGGWAPWLRAIRELPHLLRMVSVLLRVLGLSMGVWLAGNAHRVQRASFLPVVTAAYLAQLAVSSKALFDVQSSHTSDASAMLKQSDRNWFVILVSITVYSLQRHWSTPALELMGIDCVSSAQTGDASVTSAVAIGAAKLPRSRRRLLSRLLRYAVVCWLLWTLLASYILNCSVRDEPIKVSLARLRHHPSTQQLLMQLRLQWEKMQREGYRQWWEGVKQQLDIGVMEESYRELGFDAAEAQTVTLAQIRKRRNQLALKFHPDKTHPESQHMTASEKESQFAKIQRAYEKLVQLRESSMVTPTSKSKRTMTSTKRTASRPATAQPAGRAAPTQPTAPISSKAPP